MAPEGMRMPGVLGGSRIITTSFKVSVRDELNPGWEFALKQAGPRRKLRPTVSCLILAASLGSRRSRANRRGRNWQRNLIDLGPDPIKFWAER